MLTKAAQALARRGRFLPIPAGSPLPTEGGSGSRGGFHHLLSSILLSRSSLPTDPSSNEIFARASAASSSGAALVEDGITYTGVATSSPRQVDPTVLQPRVVIYDGVCHLCHSGVKWVIRADKHKKIKFCCLQSKAAEPYLRLCGLDQEDVLKRFLFVEGLYSYHQASTAALKVLSYLPFPYSAMSIFLMVPSPLRDLIYDYVAKRRYDWFGKEDKCIIMPEDEMISRFIDRDELHENQDNHDKRGRSPEIGDQADTINI